MHQQNKGESIGERLKAARERLGLSQSEAAIKWKISKRTLEAWEQGRREPRGLYLEAAQRILGE